jgi:hypothetical protein
MDYLNIVSNDKQKSSQKLQAPSVFLPISISILPMYPRHAETQARLQQQTKELFSMTLLLGIREGHIFFDLLWTEHARLTQLQSKFPAVGVRPGDQVPRAVTSSQSRWNPVGP